MASEFFLYVPFGARYHHNAKLTAFAIQYILEQLVCRGFSHPMEVLETVNGGKAAGLGIVGGQGLAVHGVIAAPRSGCRFPGIGIRGACGELRG